MLFTFTDLEPRKKAEEALRKSEERFAKAFRMAPVPSLVLCGDDLQVLDINQAFSETFGYQAEELLGESTVACGLWQDGGAERLGELLARAAACATSSCACSTRIATAWTAWSRPRR